ncbi:MAG: DUF554 domain-containing protein [Firmicutes bacterium]|nr:DUF554 domain-containing protein [Bacillota bacterium]
MIGLGTIINTLGIVTGGLFGHLFGKILKKRHRASLITACGISVIFIGIAGAMQGMLTVNGSIITSDKAMLVSICLVLGTLIGELINIEGIFEKFGEWLKSKTGNEKDNSFVNAFVTATLTVCIGAMAVVGAIQDGISGDYSILATKSLLDFVVIMIMTSSLGKGTAFSAIPVLILEGGITLFARFLSPIITDLAMDYLSLIGSILIFCVGLNLIRDKKIRVANMLPSLILAVIAAFIKF